jgi:hypothetical protein
MEIPTEVEVSLLEIIEALAERRLLYFTADRGPADTFKDALFSGVGDEQLVALVSRWTMDGQVTGHEWYHCSSCGELRLMVPAPRRLCTTNVPLMPRRCPGHMVRIQKRPVLNGRIKRWVR